MCRLLCVRAGRAIEVQTHLQRFAAIAHDSTEYQGHGWGCAWLQDNAWHIYRDIRPVWEDRLESFPATCLLLAHARSAFRDEGICVENNMPFFDGQRVFLFNGELRGVRIKERGRIGAEKIFNYIRRFDTGDRLAALRKALPIIEKRTRYVRAMNILMADARETYIATTFNEDSDYFQMWLTRAAGVDIVCSEPYPGEAGWHALANGTVTALSAVKV